MATIVINVLKDDLLRDREVRIAAAAMVNKGMHPKKASFRANKSVSKIQYTQILNTIDYPDTKVNPYLIAKDIVGNRPFFIAKEDKPVKN